MENEKKILKNVSRKSKRFQIELKDFNQFSKRDNQFSHLNLLVDNTQSFVSNLFQNECFENKQENLPIILLKDYNICTQTLMKECIDYQIKNSNKNFKDIFLPIFVNFKSPENSAFYVIYQILIKLRKIFDIRKRVNLSEEKLRINFYIWLLMVSKKLKNSNHYDGDLYIIIDNAHLIEDKQKQQIESNLKFWIPKNLPDRVKIILTLKNDSHNIQYFKDINSKILQLQYCHLKQKRKIRDAKTGIKNIIQKQDDKLQLEKLFDFLMDIDNSIQLDPNYYQFIFDFAKIYFSNDQNQYHKLAKNWLQQMDMFNFIINQTVSNKRIYDILQYILTQLEKILGDNMSFAIFCFCLCRNLQFFKQNELMKISKMNLLTFETVKVLFPNFIIQNNQKVKIISSLFKENIEIYLSSTQINSKAAYKKMVQILKKRGDSINKQEEIAYCYYKSSELFFLKQKISRIDNFIVLYNENSKYNLFKYWKILEEKGYDPVHEYNKSLELFDMHYNLQDNEIFFLNSQLSLFFKELSEFESKITPKFRHPIIQNKVVQNKVKLYEKPNKQKIKSSLEQIFKNVAQSIYSDPLDKIYLQYCEIFKQQEIVPFIDNLQIDDKNNTQLNYLDDMGIQNELISLNLVSNSNLDVQPHELLNLEIQSNRKKFINYFTQTIEKGTKKNILDDQNYKEHFRNSTNEEIDDNFNRQKILLINSKKCQKDFMSSLIDNIDLRMDQVKEPVFYYYKRWMWMNFPFMCLSKQDTEFSILMSYCYTDLCDYLPYQEVQNFYFYCRCIIDNLKNKKKNILKPQIMIQQDGKVNKNISLATPQFNSNFHHQFKDNKHIIQKQNLSCDRKNFNNSFALSQKKKKNKLKAMSFRKIQDKDVFFQQNQTGQNSNVYKLQKTLDKANQSKKKAQKKLQNKLKQIYMYTTIDKLKQDKFLSFNLSYQDMYNNIDNNKGILNQKNLRIQQELNKIQFQNKDLKHQIIQVETIKTSKDQQLIQRKIMKSEIYERNQQEITMLKGKIDQMKNRLKFVEQKQFRYQEIIDICQINQIQNENTIKNLNYYLRNLQKIIEQEQKEQMQNQKKIVFYKNASVNVFKKYQNSENVLQTQIGKMKENINREIEINNIIQNSDFQINKEIQKFIKKKQKQIVKKQIQEEQKKQKLDETKKEIDIEYSNKLEGFYEQHKNLFQDKENIYQNNWHQKQNFKNTIFLLQRRKSIQVFQKESYENITNVNK